MQLEEWKTSSCAPALADADAWYGACCAIRRRLCVCAGIGGRTIPHLDAESIECFMVHRADTEPHQGRHETEPCKGLACPTCRRLPHFYLLQQIGMLLLYEADIPGKFHQGDKFVVEDRGIVRSSSGDDVRVLKAGRRWYGGRAQTTSPSSTSVVVTSTTSCGCLPST